MQPLDFGSVQLPNLSDTDKYPMVDHAPECIDDQPFDTKSCHATPLVRVRPYAFTTEALGKLKQPRPLHPILPPLPPTFGTHCPTIEQLSDPEVGDAADIQNAVLLKNGDACRPVLIQQITFPCTKIEVKVHPEAPIYPPHLELDEAKDKRDDKKCKVELKFNMRFPPFGSDGFIVTDGDTNTDSPYVEGPCANVGTKAIMPGIQIHVLDVGGRIVAAGTVLPDAQHLVYNRSKEVMVVGDRVRLEEAVIQPVNPLDPHRWDAYPE